MINVQKYLTMFIPCIQRFSIIVRDLGSLYSKDSAFFKIQFGSVVSPEGELDLEAALICKLEWSLVFRRLVDSIIALRLEGGNWTYYSDDSDCIHSPGLFEVVDLFNGHKTEAKTLYLVVIWDFFNLWISIKDQAIVVLDTCVFLISNLDRAVAEQVNRALFQPFIPFFCNIIKECGYDLSAHTVHEINVEEDTWGFRILPRFLRVLLCHTSLNLPVIAESIKGFDWCVVDLLIVANIFCYSVLHLRVNMIYWWLILSRSRFENILLDLLLRLYWLYTWSSYFRYLSLFLNCSNISRFLFFNSRILMRCNQSGFRNGDIKFLLKV